MTPSEENSLGKMKLLLESMGMIVTSTNGGKHVAGSDHYKDRAIDFVPKAGMSAFTKSEMREKLTEAGVNIRVNEHGTEQFFDARTDPQEKGHRPHFHLAWNGTPSAEGQPGSLSLLFHSDAVCGLVVHHGDRFPAGW